ncbi:helix-turn-helix domain-containing protein [Streptomyces sp. YGL11-2]|uniref:helix-turn-helix domain-containing protein n=1 Tax=Streptomyces sp. YGL11-2 TaxID=3414028 RepID=UPI003CF7CCE6
MSVDAREWGWEHSSSKGVARLVLLSIADRVPDEQCVAWASLASLVTRTNASRTAVRTALAALAESGELELLDHLDGPQRTSVYRLPRAAAWLAKVAEATKDDPNAYVEPPTDSDPVPELDEEAEKKLRRYGIWPKKGRESDPSQRNPTGAESDPSRRNPTPRRAGIRTVEGTDSAPQNRSEPKVNRKGSSSGAAVTSAGEWQIDPATHDWARQHGHLDRLGEEGLQAADAKWRAHRADFKPRTAASWAADWRSWVAREHAPSRPKLYALPGSGSAPKGGMTLAEAHTAALLAALGEPTGEGAIAQ